MLAGVAAGHPATVEAGIPGTEANGVRALVMELVPSSGV